MNGGQHEKQRNQTVTVFERNFIVTVFCHSGGEHICVVYRSSENGKE
jgi:hypothetical protein